MKKKKRVVRQSGVKDKAKSSSKAKAKAKGASKAKPRSRSLSPSGSGSDSDSDSSGSYGHPNIPLRKAFGGGSDKAAAKRQRKPVKDGTSGASKGKGRGKGKTQHEEAIEDNTGEAREAGPPGKKIRRRDEVSDDDKQRYVKSLIDDMLRAAEDDHALFAAGKPALSKEAMLERVRQDLLKSDLHEVLLTGVNTSDEGKVGYGPSVFDAVAAWLRPVDRRSLPMLRLRTTLFKCIDQLPAELDHLKGSSRIGELLMEFRDRPEETAENKRLLDNVIRRWMRMIMGKADSHVRAHRQEAEAEPPAPGSATQLSRSSSTSSATKPSMVAAKSLADLIDSSSDSEADTATPKVAKPKPAYQSVHARVPESVVFDFVKSPVMPTLDIKARPKAPENSGLAQLEKKLKEARRKKLK